MRVLFDQGTPVPLRLELTEHNVSTAYELGWSNLSNGDLLRETNALFEVHVTTDQNMVHQQNLSGFRLAIVVLSTTSWPVLRLITSRIGRAISAASPGEIIPVPLLEDD